MHFSKIMPVAFAALGAAQTYTSCDPTKKTCPNNPAIAATFETDFTKGADAVKGWTTTAGSLTYGSDGALFTINKRGDAPTIQTNGYLFFGYVEVKMKASAGQGIISSIVLESDDLDEVDWEFIGTTTTNVQTNYFGKGNTTTYDRMIPENVATPQQTVHTYALNWTAESLTWLIDGTPMRTLNYNDAVGGKNYPQTPSNLRIGIWAGGDEANSPGTIEWAGGKTDYSKAPFTMSVQSVKIINYSPGTEYQWGDQTGSWQSIKVIGAGNQGGNAVNSAVISAPAANATASATGGQGLGSVVNNPTSGTLTGAFATQTGVFNASRVAVSTIPLVATVSSSGTVYATTTGFSTVYSTVAGSTGGAKGNCTCGVATVTVTEGEGVPPSTFVSVPVPSSKASSVIPPVPSSVTLTQGTITQSASIPVATVQTSTKTGGLITDTAPAPSRPATTIPVSGNATSTLSTGVPLFTGAANKVPVSGYSLAGILLSGVIAMAI